MVPGETQLSLWTNQNLIQKRAIGVSAQNKERALRTGKMYPVPNAEACKRRKNVIIAKHGNRNLRLMPSARKQEARCPTFSFFTLDVCKRGLFAKLSAGNPALLWAVKFTQSHKLKWRHFIFQSDVEKLEGLPVAPFMDRDKVKHNHLNFC